MDHEKLSAACAAVEAFFTEEEKAKMENSNWRCEGQTFCERVEGHVLSLIESLEAEIETPDAPYEDQPGATNDIYPCASRTTRLANWHVTRIAKCGKQGPAFVAVYDDGVILYLIVDQQTVQAVTAAIQHAIVELGRSDNGSVVVILLKANAWIAAVDAVNEIVPVMFSDKTHLDHNTIDLVVQLADWCLRPDK